MSDHEPVSSMVPQRSVYHDILPWSNTRPAWVKDALRRIVTTGTISEKDFSELILMARGDQRAKQPVPFDASHIPVGNQSENVTLGSISQTQGVNNLLPSQTLSFKDNLNVVFGYNGVGKSGYARIIKSACKARGSTPRITSNIFEDADVNQSARIEFSKGSLVTHHDWTPEENNTALNHAFVFDTAVAQHYLSVEDESAFTPFGLDVPPKLARLFLKLREQIGKEAAAKEASIESIREILSEYSGTPVGDEILGLNADSDVENFLSRFQATDTDLKRLKELEKTLANDPIELAKQTLASKSRIEKFLKLLEPIHNLFTLDAMELIRAKEKNIADALQTALSPHTWQERFQVKGTGDDSWSELWRSAIAFSESHGLPKFAEVQARDLCVLCQTPLGIEGAEVFQNVSQLLADNSQQHLAKVKDELYTLLNKYRSLRPLTQVFEDVAADLERYPAELIITQTYIEQLDKQIAYAQSLIANDQPASFIAVENTALMALRNVVGRLEILAEEQRSSAEPEKRRGLEDERKNIQAKQWVTKNGRALSDHVANHVNLKQLKRSERQCSTRSITELGKSLTSNHVTEQYCQAFEAEIEAINLKTIRVKLASKSGKKGSTKFGLILEEKNHESLVQIASEGEQRCLALAAFMAELKLANHRSSLIFDDPVSSLDQSNRRAIAKRLVAESEHRQVIIFTHDPVFLTELQSLSENSATATYRAIEWGFDGNSGRQRPGRVLSELPWDFKTPQDRLDKLAKKGREIAARSHPHISSEDVETLSSLYSKLRAVMESIVERVLLCGVVKRFDSYIPLNNIGKVADIPQSETSEISRLTQICHNITDAHETATALCSQVSATEFLQAVEDAERLIKTISNRRKISSS